VNCVKNCQTLIEKHIYIVNVGSWYLEDVNALVSEDLETGADTPRSNSYVINGQPGDLLPCSQGTYVNL
jgi:laccase